MEPELLFSFLIASVILTLMPGPDNIFVLTESITKGQRNGLAISAGLSSGILIHTLIAATGLSVIIQQSMFIFSFIKYLGAAYLIYQAYGAAKEKQPEITIDTVVINSQNSIQLVRKGFLMNVLNPKVTIFFIAFLPQFISQSKGSASFQMMTLGFIFMLQAFIIFSSIALLSGRLSTYLNSAQFWKITKWSKVSILAILGLLLAGSER